MMEGLHIVAGDLIRLDTADYRPFLSRVGTAVVKNIDARTPYKTGELVRGNDFEVIGNDGLVFTNDVYYAAYVHNGTAPHVIRPKNAGGVLVFEIGGQTIYTKLVNHPGTKAQPFIDQGILDSIPMMEQMGVANVDAILGSRS